MSISVTLEQIYLNTYPSDSLIHRQTEDEMAMN